MNTRLRAVLAAGVLAVTLGASTSATPRASAPDEGTVTLQRGTFERRLRLAGTVEAVRVATAVAPRLSGQSAMALTITRLVAGGSRVKTGDVLVEFDPQEQARAAFDRRAEYLDLEEQIRKKIADQAAARASEESTLEQAANDVARATLETEKNPLLAAIDAEKNTLALEQARARLAQLEAASPLKQRAAAADRRILEIRRDRARQAMLHAEQNTSLMTIRAPFDGLAVLKSTFKGSQMAEVQEGDQVRPSVPLVDVVDSTAMRVRARVNQADCAMVTPGQAARVLLDAYPDLGFAGRIEMVSPLGVPSSLTPKVREFVEIVSISGHHARLMPDLSAAVDVAVERIDNVLVLPREAVSIEADGAWVRLARGGSFLRQAITIGAVNPDQVVVAAGLKEGAVVARRALGGS